MDKIIIGSFDDVDDADRAYRDLLQSDFGNADVNLIMGGDKGPSGLGSPSRPALVPGGSATVKGAVAGGIRGGAAGLTASLLGLAVAGIDVILNAGPIVATLAGAAAGAVAGGLIGRLTEASWRRDESDIAPEATRHGISLVTVRTNELRENDAAAILRKNGAVDITRRVEDSRPTGWTKPAADEVDRDRARFAASQEELATADVADGLSDGAWGPRR